MILFSKGRDVLVPKILFGPTRKTRQAWSRVVRQLMEADEVATVFSRLELLSLDETDSIIILRELSPGWSTDDDVWHANWIHSRWLFPKWSGRLMWRKQFEIVMTGLAFPWYTLGMFFQGFNDFYFTRLEFIQMTEHGRLMDEQQHRQEIYFPWLDRMLFWLEEVSTYKERFRYTSWGCEPWCFEGAIWLWGILMVARECGCCTSELLSASKNMTYSEVIESLLASRKIERREGRLRVVSMS